ncbi:MAG: RNA-directed DNA polymerase [Nanoarchaeota archaeon]
MGETSGQSPTQGMPLGNLTSQFFANIYLNKLDYFVKHTLRAKYYIRYVDDFVILHKSKEQLTIWKEQINNFLIDELKLELHPDKSKIIPISHGVDFVGFRNFYHFKLLRKRNIKKMKRRVIAFSKADLSYSEMMNSFQGWCAHSKWANSYKLRKEILKSIHKAKQEYKNNRK